MNDPNPSERAAHRIRLMNSSVRHTSKFFNTAAALVVAATIVLLFRMATLYTSLPNACATAEPPSSFQRAHSPLEPGATPLAGLYSVMRSAERGVHAGELSRRFRLAGTILSVSNIAAGEPMAIIDDRDTVTQRIVVRNGEVVPGVVLTQVRAESVVLNGPAGEEEIFLEKAGGEGAMASVGALTVEPLDAGSAPEAFDGKQVFPNRWEFDRTTLLDYYAELRNEPERLLSVFDSMDPVYVTDPDGERRITGYVVDVVGEADFFSAAGLSNGDIVRSVNSVLMTNRRRAESFIKSFVEGELTTFVLEVERNGETSKQVYMVK